MFGNQPCVYASVSLYVLCVYVYFLESIISGDYKITQREMFRVKKSEYDPEGITLRVPMQVPNVGQESRPSHQDSCLGKIQVPHSKISHSLSKNNIRFLEGEAPRRGLVLRWEFKKFKLYLTSIKWSNQCRGVFSILGVWYILILGHDTPITLRKTPISNIEIKI